VPSRAQVYVTPGAQKSIEDAQKSGEPLRVARDRAPEKPTVPPKKAEDMTSEKKAPATAKKAPKKQKLSLTQAVLAELRDKARTIRLGIQLNTEDIIRGVICGALLMLFALLQTTFFVRFAPFSKIPDLMLIFVLAIGVYEGEKWGAVTGLIAAFVIQSLGGDGSGPELLSLVYMPVGCISGLASKYYLRHTLPVKAVYVVLSALLRSAATIVSALVILDASLYDIVTKIALPEYLSTVVLSPLPFVVVWLSFRHFHKTRAERTDRSEE